MVVSVTSKSCAHRNVRLPITSAKVVVVVGKLRYCIQVERHVIVSSQYLHNGFSQVEMTSAEPVETTAGSYTTTEVGIFPSAPYNVMPLG